MNEEKGRREVEREKREAERLEKVRQKEAERVRKEEEKLRKEEEKIRKEDEKRRREEERQKKEVEREQERLRKEEEKRRKDEEREQERLRKEEEKRKKDEEREQERLKREEEKRKKDEEKELDRLRKEDEKRKREEEKEQERLKKEEEKRKKEEEKEQERLKKEQKARRQADFMASFLKKTPVPSSTEVAMDVDPPATPTFKPMPFQLKSGMTLAPVHRRPSESLDLVKKELFVSFVDSTAENISIFEFEPYLIELKKRGGRKYKRTEIIKEVEEDEVVIIDPKVAIENPAEDGLIKWRWKLLQFHANVRPPYWGTWKRKPVRVKGRKPFSKDDEIDYDFDSDDEWEEEPEDGEELGDKDDADKEEDEKCGGVGDENTEDFDDEDDFLVPHGYLSDDEGGVAEYRDKDTLKFLEEEFYRDLKRENINGLPIIETDDLDQYRMIFYPNREVEESDMDVGEEDIAEDMDTDNDQEDAAVVVMTTTGIACA